MFSKVHNIWCIIVLLAINSPAQSNKFSDFNGWKNTLHTERPISDNTIKAIKQKETPYRPGTLDVGDNGKALGPLQIHLGFYRMATNYNPSLSHNYSYSDVTNYLYASYVARSGLNATFPKNEVWNVYNLARTFNGGQGGIKNPKTVKYGRDVEKFYVGIK